MNTRKIRSLLESKYEQILSELNRNFASQSDPSSFMAALEEAWANYLNGIDCEILTEEDVLEDFDNLFNDSSKTKICVRLPDTFRPSIDSAPYILVPKKLAEKALILGGLPDFWHPDS